MQQYVVIENTPGYLPEDDDPGIFEDYADAVAYANELADRCVEYYQQGDDDAPTVTVDKGWASSDNLYAISVTSDEPYSLGRWIAVQFYDDEEDTFDNPRDADLTFDQVREDDSHDYPGVI